MENSYLFILGNHPNLSQMEIKNYLSFLEFNASFSSVTPDILLVNTKKNFQPNELIKTLGGTIKIARVFKTENQFELNYIIDFLENTKKTKLDFGISFYNFDFGIRKILDLSKRVKKSLKNTNIKTNFTLGKNDGKLSSAQVENKIIAKNGEEIIIVKTDNKIIYAQTQAIQNIRIFSQLDYGIPKACAKIGMLPPKLAQIMINISLPEKYSKGTIIYDPFCGTGRIILQSLFSGLEVYGSDINPNAVKNTIENSQWLNDNFKLQIKPDYFQKHIFIHDATKPNNLKIKIDSIVTEPSLGPALKNMPREEEIKQIFNELKELYLESFSHFKDNLKPNAKIICIFPKIGKNSLLDMIIDNICSLGYYMVSNFEYKRDYQIVARHIGVFSLSQI